MKKLFFMLMLTMMSIGAMNQSAFALPQQQHLTKSGKPDKRYSENKHLKKDGTPDMRYKSSKKAAAKKSK
jgi:hypothetical protein